MTLTSPEFKNNGFIPKKFTCQGEDINPELVISEVPKNALSLALIMEDPDASGGNWVHWVVYNINASVSKIKENSIPGDLGLNTLNEKSYHGPCPPIGTHRYFFKIYALNIKPNLKTGLSKGALLKSIEGCVIEKAELIGLYQKEK